MPYRIAIGSCSHPSLPQPLWKIIHGRRPAAFIWAGDAVYSDIFAGLNWTAVGLHRVHDGESHNATGKQGGGWRLTFPPPSIHLDATPDIIDGWYKAQWDVEDYRRFVEGWYDPENGQHTRPIIFGTIDDHDYGQNNGDITYQYKRESNLAFVDFLYAGVLDENQCAVDAAGDQNICESSQDENHQHSNEDIEEGATHDKLHSFRTESRKKSNDPMYQRALDGKGVYGVQLFDFSQTREVETTGTVWGGGHRVPDEVARIDPDVSSDTHTKEPSGIGYSTTHSVAIFALDVRSNKTPWPKGKTAALENANYNNNSTNATSINAPMLDFLGQHQWEWFQSALNNSHANVNIIVSGLQVHPERFPNDGNVIEEWSKFPEARQMLYDMILNSGVKSPLLVSGDVHMAQIMRKDCIQSSDMVGGSISARPHTRPLLEVTTSGMTHSWGTSFSSQPKNHRMPLKLYTYFVSRTFMTICHYVCPWKDILIRTIDDVKRETGGLASTQDQDNPEQMARGGRLGKQYFLGLNFAEFEFDFHDAEQDSNGNDGGAVTVRIFGKEANAPPKLEAKWTFDQLSGKAHLPGMTAKFPGDFLTVGQQNPNTQNSQIEHEWICVSHRGLASIYHEYAANITMFCTFCILFFFPHALCVWLITLAKRHWYRQKKIGTDTDKVPQRQNGCTNVN